MECPKDVEKYNNMINHQRVYVFLAGLDTHLDAVRGCILATTLPSKCSINLCNCLCKTREKLD